MLLQTNSYIVPNDRRAEHERLVRRFKQVMGRLGCEMFEVYEQVGPNWSGNEATGRFVQIMRFRDRKHQLAVQAAERSDAGAQALIAEFCELINLPHQQQQSMFLTGYYRGVVTPTARELGHVPPEATEAGMETQQEQPAEGLAEQPMEMEAQAGVEQAVEGQIEEPVNEQPQELPLIEAQAVEVENIDFDAFVQEEGDESQRSGGGQANRG
jgi:hypothetical protein